MLIYNTIPNLLLAAINIVEFFLLIRAITLWKEIKHLTPFNTASNCLVNRITTFTDELFRKLSTKPLTTKSNIAITLMVLELIRLLLCSVS